MLVTQAYRFELDPNDRCRSKLASHAGAARFAYSWGVSLVGNHLAARRALGVLAIWHGAGREDAECWADGLLGPLPWTLPALWRAWNQAKVSVAPWWAESSKEAYSSGLDALAGVWTPGPSPAVHARDPGSGSPGSRRRTGHAAASR